MGEGIRGSPGRTRRRSSDRSVRIIAVLGGLFVLALVILPYWFHHRFVGLYTQRVRVIDPAETQVDRLQFALAREAAAKRGYLLSGDSAFRVRAQDAAAEREQAMTELDSLSVRLQPDTRASVNALREAVARWGAAREPGPSVSPQPGEVRLRLDQDAYEAALVASFETRALISAERDTLARTLQGTERQWAWAEAALFLLALATVAMVFWAAHQIRYHETRDGAGEMDSS